MPCDDRRRMFPRVMSLVDRLLRADASLTRRRLLADTVRGAAALALGGSIVTSPSGLIFPAHPLTVGPMPRAGTGVDAWDQLAHTTWYPGGIDPFTVVPNPVGHGLVIRNVNHLDYPNTTEAKHTTAGTNDDEQKGHTFWFADAFLWLSKAEFTQKDWALVEQQQQIGSPSQAWSPDKATNRWFMNSRDGTVSKKFMLDLIQFGHWATLLVGQHLDTKPNGWTEWVMAHDYWPRISGLYRRAGIGTYQGSAGRNTVGIYGEHGYTGSYIGYQGPAGRGATPEEAIANAKIGAKNMGFLELAA